MNAKHLIAALTVIAASATAYAADAPALDNASQQPQAQQQQAPLLLASAAADGVYGAPYASVNFPSALPKKNGPRGRAEVKAEAVEAVRHHQNTLAQQYDFYK